MTKHSGPLLGYNNNIPYKGNVYHVQTEDSGTKRPHVFTHLFADGGRIVKTMKTSYAHFVGTDNLTEKVRALMREQHKAMVISLRDGELDVLIDEGRSAIEEREAPKTLRLDDVETGDAAEESGEGAEPIELTARSGASEGGGQEITEPPRPSSGAEQSAGTYSFVGGSGPAQASSPPGTTQPPQDEGPTTVTRGRTATSTGRRGAGSRTEPDLALAHQHAAPTSRFGEAFVSGRRFDEVVRAFLEGGA